MARPELRVISGGRDCKCEFRGVRIWLDDRPPPGFHADVEVLEEDTFRVLSAPAELRHEVIEEPFETLVERMTEIRTTPVGSVIERQAVPLEFLAVVYDFDADPVIDAQTVRAALSGIMALATRRRARQLAIPLLGLAHGRFEPTECVRILRDLLEEGRAGEIRAIWLQAPRRWDCRWLSPLARASMAAERAD